MSNISTRDTAQTEPSVQAILETAQKFNDRTLNTIAWIGSALLLLVSGGIGLATFNLNSERDRIERSIGSFEERFAKLNAEVRGAKFDAPRIEILGTDQLPLVGRAILAKIEEESSGATPEYFLRISYLLRNAGKGYAGKVWTKIYLDFSEKIVGADSNPDETGFKQEIIIPYTSWAGTYSGTSGDFPGAGFTVNVTSSLAIQAKQIPAGKHRVMIKVFYGSSDTQVERIESHFILESAWVRPMNKAKS